MMTSDLERRLLRVLDHIHDHPAGDLSLDALADVAAMSRFHWHRLFRAMTGQTMAQAVRRMRMHRAATALVMGEAPLHRVAAEVGYSDVTSFTRAFSDVYGLGPAAFRRRGTLYPVSFPARPEVTLMYPVTIRIEPERRLAALPHRGPYHQINRAFEKLYALLAARDMIDQSEEMIATYYDDPAATAPDDLRSHAGAVFPPGVVLAPPLDVVILPAGRHAVLTFTGPYAGLPAAYDQLYAVWLPQSGEQPADSPPFENYLNSPMNTPQEALVTEICVPLARP